jgi:hypothetical protein
LLLAAACLQKPFHGGAPLELEEVPTEQGKTSGKESSKTIAQRDNSRAWHLLVA